MGGPTTESRAIKDEKDTNLAKAAERPLRLNSNAKQILFGPSAIVTIALVALLSLGYYLMGSGWYQETVTSKPSSKTTGKSKQSDQSNSPAFERPPPTDYPETAGSRPTANERRVATMLLDRGAELLLYPTKRVSSVDELPAGEFVVLNIVADMAQITDDDCREIGTLSAVKSLHMPDNPLTGEGLRHFAGFKALQWLYLGSCEFDDGGVRYLLPHGAQLKSLDLSATRVTTHGLNALTGFRVLRELLLADNDITDDGLIGLERFPSLLRLNLAGTGITDNGLRHLETCHTLRYLVLDRTPITDDGIPALSRLENLETISLRETAVSEAGITRLQEALPKCQITL